MVFLNNVLAALVKLANFIKSRLLNKSPLNIHLIKWKIHARLGFLEEMTENACITLQVDLTTFFFRVKFLLEKNNGQMADILLKSEKSKSST